MPMTQRVRRALTAALAATAVLAAIAATAGASRARAVTPGAATSQVQREAPASAGDDVAAAASDRSAPVTVLLVGLGATVGVLVGLLPVLAVAMLLGHPRPSRHARDPRAEPASPTAPGPAAASTPTAAHAPPPSPPARGPATGEPARPPVTVLAPARHQGVYDAAFAEQSERVTELRSAIAQRLRTRRPSPR